MITALPEAEVLIVKLDADPAGVQLVLIVQLVAGHWTGVCNVVNDLITSYWPPPTHFHLFRTVTVFGSAGKLPLTGPDGVITGGSQIAVWPRVAQ